MKSIVYSQPWRLKVILWIKRFNIYLIAFLTLSISLLPVLWTLSIAMMNGDAMLLPPRLIPSPVYWGNFESVIKSLYPGQPVLHWFRNSIFLTVVNVIGQILFSLIAGFGFARFRFRMRRMMYGLMMSTLIIPPIVKIVPQYMMFASWGWTNSYLPITMPTWFSGAFLIFLFYQYFCSIPYSLDESAKIDGASPFQIFISIILPLSLPILATAVVLTFMSNWNLFLEPYIYLHRAEKYTLAVVLGYDRWEKTLSSFRAAFILFYALPVVVLFFLLQHYFVKGIQISVIKE